MTIDLYCDLFTRKDFKRNQRKFKKISVFDNLTITREEWGGDSGERGFQELLKRTHEQNQGGGWR